MKLKNSKYREKELVNGIYKIESKSEKKRTLQKSGDLAILEKWTGNQDQKWNLDYVSPGYLNPGGYVISTIDGKNYLSWDKDKNKVVVTGPSYKNEYTKYWNISSNSDGSFTFENGYYPNPILTTNGSNYPVYVTDGSNSDTQKFYLTKDPINPIIEEPGSLVITSDPQYPWTEKTDLGESETESEKQSRSYALISEQYNNINDYTDSVENSSIFINGDITAYGHGWQRENMNNLLKILKKPYYYGLGNHDIINNYNDCESNNCANGTFHDYAQKLLSLKLPESRVDIKKESGPQMLSYSGSFAYSIDFGKIYAIQLNCYPGMQSFFDTSSGGMYYKYNLEENFEWLENELKIANGLDKAIIINVHYPDGFTDKYKDLLNYYGVKAIFAGHYHMNVGLDSTLGTIPIFLSGSASQSTYLILEYDNESMKIYSVKNNDWKNKDLIQTIGID